ncbi:MAG: efflux RND transporter permease subunit, partial [Rhodobiaceae bacterium]|nr:efflux RND transporter permease subunit [Rhodobiaceae bacterium]
MIGMLQGILSRPKTVLVMMLFLVAAGVMSYITIPKEANPDIDVPVFYVSVTQQGLSPEDGVRLIARPMETTLRGLDGLKEITTVSSEGHVGIVLEFDISFDKDEALSDVRDKVDQAKAEIPAEADEPTITETNFSLEPTIIVALSGNVPERTLYRHARRLKDEIESIPTVLSADLKGHREELLEVVIDQLKLESYDVTQAELITAVTRNNQLVAAGSLDTGNGRFNVKVPGLFETADDVRNLPVKVEGDGVVTLGDVAELRRTFKDPTIFTRVNGKPAITIQVVKRLGTNIIDNNAQVRQVVTEFTKDWPNAIDVNFMIDQSNFIYEVLGSLQSSILTAVALVMIVVVASLGFRSGLLVGIAIPTSFLLGFLILTTLGMTVNMMVMFGMVLTVGMLVDSAIVIIEYADRKIAEGFPRDEAYKRAARLMFWPVVSSTATTLAAFLPLLLWPGVSGEFMGFLPKMVIIVLSASLVTAMIFLPALGEFTGAIAEFFGRYAARIFAILGILCGVVIGGFGS